MYCPTVKIANEVVERFRELNDAELVPMISGLEWLRNNPLPSADEQCMGIPPDRFVRSLTGTEWVVGYDVHYRTGHGKFLSLWPQEIWVWFIGAHSEIAAKLTRRYTA